MTHLEVKVRAVTDDDCRLLWEWASDPAVRAAAFHSNPIPWEEHVAWFHRKRADGNCAMYIVTDERGRPVGQVRFDLQADGSAEVDLSVARERRGRGYGAAALQLACWRLVETRPVRRVVGRVKPENLASIRAFERAGFARQGKQTGDGIDAVHLVHEVPPGARASHATPEHPITVLVTGAGGAGTIELIRAMKKQPRYRIVAVDASPHAAGFAFADRGHVVPWATDPSFQADLERLIADERPDFIVPLVDEEIPIVHALVATLPAPQPRIVTPALPFCLATLDKWRTFDTLRRAGIPTPPTWLASEAEGCTFPAVIKPRDGRGSRELAYLDNPDDLRRCLAACTRPAATYVVQQRVQGREYTVSTVVGLGGPTLAVVPKEVIVKRGITQVGVTRIVPDIDRLCRQIQDRLQANGPFNVQLILADDGTPTVIEINPRYSTTVALTIAAGINEVDVVIRRALGEPIGPLAFQPNLMMVRYPTQMYVPESEWPPPTVTQWGVAAEQGAHQV